MAARRQIRSAVPQYVLRTAAVRQLTEAVAAGGGESDWLVEAALAVLQVPPAPDESSVVLLTSPLHPC